MEARYTRIVGDTSGQSRFEDLEVGLSPGLAVPPSQPLHNAPFLAAEETFWIGAPIDWRGETPHPAPARMVFVTVRGEYEVTASDGSTRRFPPGSVLLLEDTTGDGHSTRIISAEAAIVFAVRLAMG
jgi:hypothetical protein